MFLIYAGRDNPIGHNRLVYPRFSGDENVFDLCPAGGTIS